SFAPSRSRPSIVLLASGLRMLALALIALATPAARAVPFEITNNKTFVRATIDRSEPLWFIFDTGNNGPSIIARECADRLKLDRGADEKVEICAGSRAELWTKGARWAGAGEPRCRAPH